jgi:hypothetical protein
MVLDGKQLNLTSNHNKTGLWIEYILIEKGCAITITKDSAENCYYKIALEYRPLAANEYCGMLQLVEHRTDTAVNGIQCFKLFRNISNKLPSEVFQVLSRGNYTNNLKEGEWEYFHKNGQPAKQIHYSKGLPDRGFKVFREDGTISLEIIKLKEGIWEIYKYSDTMRKVGGKRLKIEDLKALY